MSDVMNTINRVQCLNNLVYNFVRSRCSCCHAYNPRKICWKLFSFTYFLPFLRFRIVLNSFWMYTPSRRPITFPPAFM